MLQPWWCAVLGDGLKTVNEIVKHHQKLSTEWTWQEQETILFVVLCKVKIHYWILARLYKCKWKPFVWDCSGMRGCFSWTLGYILVFFWASRIWLVLKADLWNCWNTLAMLADLCSPKFSQALLRSLMHIWAWICVWTTVPCPWQQLLLELSSSDTIFSTWHLRLVLHEFVPSPGAQTGLCRTHSFCYHRSGGVEIHPGRHLQFSLYVTEVKEALQSPQDHQSSELWIICKFSCIWATYYHT